MTSLVGAAANVKEARKQLARSLLFLEWACKQVYGEWHGQGLRYILTMNLCTWSHSTFCNIVSAMLPNTGRPH